MGYGTLAKQLEDDLNQRITAGMESTSLDLTGSDMLAALADAATFQRKLASATQDVIVDILEQGRSELSAYLEPSGLQTPFDLYASNWPVKLNRSVLDKINDELERRINDSRNDHLLRLATKLADLKPLCETAIQGLSSMICGTASLLGLCITMPHFQNWFNMAFGLKTDGICSSKAMFNRQLWVGPSSTERRSTINCSPTGANSGGKQRCLSWLLISQSWHTWGFQFQQTCFYWSR